jgi:hypothetical protein
VRTLHNLVCMRAMFLNPSRRSAPLLSVLLLTVVVGVASGQTKVTPHKNSFTPAQDVELGQQAAAEVRKEMPMLGDGEVDSYVQNIGRRLVNVIPSDLQHPEFRYTFTTVNLKEINAFALPGGPMFLNRGMLEAAKTEGEVAGVMAHELSHVILRHGTAQATKAQKFQIGAVAGQVLGAIVGGTAGSVIAQGSQFGLGTYFLKYSREYEREADLVGAQLMARAGYDPRQMANMFRTIEEQGGSGGPQWLSDHPNPGNRYQYINQEAAALRIERSVPSSTQFASVQARLRSMPPAKTTQEATRTAQAPRGGTTRAPADVRVEEPSESFQTYNEGNLLRVSVPSNWRETRTNSSVTFAPDGAFFQGQNGGTAFTHGIEVGALRNDSRDLREGTDQFVESLARSNPQLRREGGYRDDTIGGRRGLTSTFSNVSEVTGTEEQITISTVPLRDGNLLYLIAVVPERDAGSYAGVFRRVRQSLQISDTQLTRR